MKSLAIFVSKAFLVALVLSLGGPDSRVDAGEGPGVPAPPDSTFTVIVTADAPGRNAAATERIVLQPLEDALSSIEGVREVDAVAREGRCELRLRFSDGDA